MKTLCFILIISIFSFSLKGMPPMMRGSMEKRLGEPENSMKNAPLKREYTSHLERASTMPANENQEMALKEKKVTGSKMDLLTSPADDEFDHDKADEQPLSEELVEINNHLKLVNEALEEVKKEISKVSESDKDEEKLHYKKRYLIQACESAREAHSYLENHERQLSEDCLLHSQLLVKRAESLDKNELIAEEQAYQEAIEAMDSAINCYRQNPKLAAHFRELAKLFISNLASVPLVVTSLKKQADKERRVPVKNQAHEQAIIEAEKINTPFENLQEVKEHLKYIASFRGKAQEEQKNELMLLSLHTQATQSIIDLEKARNNAECHGDYHEKLIWAYQEAAKFLKSAIKNQEFQINFTKSGGIKSPILEQMVECSRGMSESYHRTIEALKSAYEVDKKSEFLKQYEEVRGYLDTAIFMIMNGINIDAQITSRKAAITQQQEYQRMTALNGDMMEMHLRQAKKFYENGMKKLGETKKLFDKSNP